MTAMALPSVWYIGSTKWTAISSWVQNTVTAAGKLIRQATAPTVDNERVFVCIIAGTTRTTGAGGEPTWVLTAGSTTTDGTVTWMECTGQPAVNGDLTNTPTWLTAAKTNTVALGQIVQRASGASYQICTTAGTAGSGSEPSFSNTAGVTTADNTVTWTSLGAVGNFAAFAAPFARLKPSLGTTWGGSHTTPTTFYISNNHAETQSTSMSLSFFGTGANPQNFICATDTAAPPTTTATTATITTTGSSNITDTSSEGVFYMYGVTFNVGTGSGAASLTFSSLNINFEKCGFNLVGTNTGSIITLGEVSTASKIYCKTCTLTFGADQTSLLGNVEWVGGSMCLSGTAPTVLIGGNSNGIGNGVTIIRDCDLSGVTGTLATSVDGAPGSLRFENCKLGAAVTVFTNSGSNNSVADCVLANCDSTNTNYRFYVNNYYGSMQQETTTVNNAGATDGTTRISWKIVTTAYPSFGLPFKALIPMAEWGNTTGSSKTLTIQIAGANSLTNADIWVELEYLSSSSYPIATSVNNRAADILTASAAVTSSSASWGGSPAHTQELQITFTPHLLGWMKAYIYVAKPSITVYVDPLMSVA